MRDLGFGLDSAEPLDIFVQIQGPPPEARLNQVDENFSSDQVWGLDVSLRGLSTLIASLQVLIEEIGRENIGIKLESVLDVLLRITRFPPVLLAFKDLWEGGLGAHTRSMEHLHLIVDVFDALCKSMVPEWMCSTKSSKLEGARQVISWIHGLCVAAESNQKLSNTIPSHVHRVEVSRKKHCWWL
jgi:hypothetical protein